jgi:hypothetical protein
LSSSNLKKKIKSKNYCSDRVIGVSGWLSTEGKFFNGPMPISTGCEGPIDSGEFFNFPLDGNIRRNGLFQIESKSRADKEYTD